MELKYKESVIDVNDRGIFTTSIKGKRREFYSFNNAQAAIDWHARSPGSRALEIILWPLGVLAFLIILGSFIAWLDGRDQKRHQADEMRRQAAIPRGIVVAELCSISAHRKEAETPPSRKVEDMGIGESACTGSLYVDSEKRAYLRNAGTISDTDPGKPDGGCAYLVRRGLGGYYLHCGKTPLPEPETEVFAGAQWAIPIKGLF